MNVVIKKLKSPR